MIQGEKKENLEDILTNLFYARFAYIDRKSHPGYAVSAMHKYYVSCPGIAKDDRVIADAINEAYAGVQDGSITNNAILWAIGAYGEGEYEKLRDNSPISTFLNSSKKLFERIISKSNNGVAKDIAEDYKDLLDKIKEKVEYRNLKYKDVEDKYKDDKDEKAAKTLGATALIEQGILGLINIDIAQDTAIVTANNVQEQIKKLYNIK